MLVYCSQRSKYAMGSGFHYLFKKEVIEYLRDQLEQFGSRQDTLMGSNYEDDIAQDPERYQKCVDWVAKKWPDED